MLQANSTVTIGGALGDDGFTGGLSSPGFRCTPQKRSRVQKRPRVKPSLQALPKIGDVPDYTNRFCDVSAGVTSEGLTLVIESHRCYAADLQGNASVMKVRRNVHCLAFH